MNTIEAIKQAVSISDFCESNGIHINHRGFACCAVHSEKTPSMMIKDGHFHCFGCGAHGDVIDLACAVWNCDKAQAMKELCRIYGVEGDKYNPYAIDIMMRKRQKEIAEERRERRIAELERQKCEAAAQLDIIRMILGKPPDKPENMTDAFAWALSNRDYYNYVYDTADAEIMNLTKGGG